MKKVCGTQRNNNVSYDEKEARALTDCYAIRMLQVALATYIDALNAFTYAKWNPLITKQLIVFHMYTLALFTKKASQMLQEEIDLEKRDAKLTLSKSYPSYCRSIS